MIKNLIIILLFISHIVIWYFYWKNSEKYNISQKDITISDDSVNNWALNQDTCNVTEAEYWVKGVSMLPLIADQSKVKVLENYYTCTPVVERWDIIIYENRATPGPIIKQVQALPNDSIRFDNKWRLYINGVILKNSIGDEYIFNNNQKKAINMYVINGKLQETSFLAFGDNVSNSDDSRRLGWLGLEYFKWKVILK